jgi:uncharacterized protein
MSHDTIDAQVLQQIITSLVIHKDDVVIERNTDEMGVLLLVKVNQEDMGVLIGRNGIMADSIKTILRAVGRTHDMNIRVKFLEPEGSTRIQAEPGKVITSDSKPAVDLDSELDEFVIK